MKGGWYIYKKRNHMSTQQHYDQWSSTYDEVENKTRDLEKTAGQRVLPAVSFSGVLELGCGTGKNTEWLQQKAERLLSVDLSEGMLAKAREKTDAEHVQFLQADITQEWSFADTGSFDLVTCSLILEHIQDLPFIFAEAHRTLHTNGFFYICELHPYKQYTGSKARFETSEGLQVLSCFVHHISDYLQAALENNFTLAALNEWFDDNDRSQPPRLVSFLFQKKDIIPD
jgi:ubiquinone/menaquinone biosynthesis C-methylase UbiE